MDKHIVESELAEEGDEVDRSRCGGDAWYEQCKMLNSRGKERVPSRPKGLWNTKYYCINNRS